jgi:hypothetical protein
MRPPNPGWRGRSCNGRVARTRDVAVLRQRSCEVAWSGQRSRGAPRDGTCGPRTCRRASGANVIALSNCATAPSTWRTRATRRRVQPTRPGYRRPYALRLEHAARDVLNDQAAGESVGVSTMMVGTPLPCCARAGRRALLDGMVQRTLPSPRRSPTSCR